MNMPVSFVGMQFGTVNSVLVVRGGSQTQRCHHNALTLEWGVVSGPKMIQNTDDKNRRGENTTLGI